MAGVEMIVNADDALARLNRLAQFDARDMLDEIGQALASTTTRRFRDSVDPEGRPWQSLRPATIKQKGSSKPLIHHGHLRDSITHEVRGDRVAVGTRMIYGAIHQFGGQAGRRLAAKIPARPYLGLSADDAAEINDIAQRHIARAIGSA